MHLHKRDRVLDLFKMIIPFLEWNVLRVLCINVKHPSSNLALDAAYVLGYSYNLVIFFPVQKFSHSLNKHKFY